MSLATERIPHRLAIAGTPTSRQPRHFSRVAILRIWMGFVATVVLGWAAAQGVRALCAQLGIAADIPPRWPLSLIKWQFPGIHTSFFDPCVALAILLVFYVVVRRFPRPALASLPAVLGLGLLLVLATNLVHGHSYGLKNPHRGPEQYYHDATRIDSAGRFLGEFETIQPRLGCHARTHPPGAVLFYYGLVKLVGDSAAVSVAIAALAVGLSGLFLFPILTGELDRDTAGCVTLLFLLMPSVQVYYCASLDAIIAGCFLGALMFVGHPRPLVAITGGAASLFCASFLTFAACFLLPVLWGFEIITRKGVRRSLLIVVTVGLLYTALYWLWGFNYVNSFRIAAALENPGGFLLLREPVSYLMTRLENVAEIAVFLGPFLLLLVVRGIRLMRQEHAHPRLRALSVLGMLTLLAMFLTGAYRTGETARACLFIYPCLIFPVAAYLDHAAPSDNDRRQLLRLVFTQSLLMQALGGYFW